MRIAIGGASGLTGTALTEALRQVGHSIIKLVRSSPVAADQVGWDPDSGTLNATDLTGVDVVINLSGENLGNRWNAERMRSFRTSRLNATRTIVTALRAMPVKPALLISSSAVGIYGAHRGDEILDEGASLGDDFLATLCRDWEECTEPAAAAGIRVVHTRTSPVLSPNGGMLEKLLLPFRLGVGGKLGDGSQWVSWIAMADYIAAVQFLMRNGNLSGAVNVTSPNPVTNQELTAVLGEVLRRPTVATVPAAALRAMLGREMADSTVLASQRVVPRRLLDSGFEFRFPTLSAALRHELGLPQPAQ